MVAAEASDSKRMLPGRHKLAVQMVAVSRYFAGSQFVVALNAINLQVRRGEVFGLLGPRGSGKSTVLRILAGRLAPSAGKVKIFGHSPRRWATRARVGYLPQEPGHARSPGFFSFARALGDFFSRAGTVRRRPGFADGSAAMERRGLLKQILVRNPELVLLDEPFHELDAAACDEMKQLIRELAQQGRTVIFTGSSLTGATETCERLAVLSRGQVEATGTLGELLASPAGLRYFAELLPPAIAERLSEVLRQEIGSSDFSKRMSREAMKAASLGAEIEGAPAGSALLCSYVKAVESDSSAPKASEPAVNHELLVALTKPPADRP
jgi:ABC-2 type transport system ATP-binding protein